MSVKNNYMAKATQESSQKTTYSCNKTQLNQELNIHRPASVLSEAKTTLQSLGTSEWTFVIRQNSSDSTLITTATFTAVGTRSLKEEKLQGKSSSNVYTTEPWLREPHISISTKNCRDANQIIYIQEKVKSRGGRELKNKAFSCSYPWGLRAKLSL